MNLYGTFCLKSTIPVSGNHWYLMTSAMQLHNIICIFIWYEPAKLQIFFVEIFWASVSPLILKFVFTNKLNTGHLGLNTYTLETVSEHNSLGFSKSWKGEKADQFGRLGMRPFISRYPEPITVSAEPVSAKPLRIPILKITHKSYYWNQRFIYLPSYTKFPL